MIDGGQAAHRSAALWVHRSEMFLLHGWEQATLSARGSTEEHIPDLVDAVLVRELIPVVSELGGAAGVGAASESSTWRARLQYALCAFEPFWCYQDMSNVGSSTGWTDDKHMLYITSLEESFVNQLYSGNGEINSVESFYRTPGVWPKTSYGGNGRSTKYDQGQGYWGRAEVDEAESRSSEVGYIGSPSCSRGPHCYVDDASSSGPRQKRTNYHGRQRTSGRSAAFNLRQHGHSFSWRTESSDQNFFDGEPKDSREQGRWSSENQQKQAGRTEVGPPGGIGLH